MSLELNNERGLRVGAFLREELSGVLLRGSNDPRFGLMTVTDVRVSRDLSVADVYVSSLAATTVADRDELVDTLRHAAGFMRSQIAQRQGLRRTPRLRFHYDDLLESGPRLEALIDEAVAGGARGGTPRMKTAARGGTPRMKTPARGDTPRKNDERSGGD